MKINPETFLFEDLSLDEQREMRAWAENAVMHGILPPQTPAWVQEWMDLGNYTPPQLLLLTSTALPQLVLISLLRARDDAAKLS